jgi:hypothetical protein
MIKKTGAPKSANAKLKETGDYLAAADYRGGARGTAAKQKKRLSDMKKATQQGPKVPKKPSKAANPATKGSARGIEKKAGGMARRSKLYK